MVPRNALVAPLLASGGLLVALLAGGCAKPTAAPEPVELPSISSSAAVTSIPAVADISVRPVATTPLTTVASTTEPPPPPPPVAVQPEPRPEPTQPEPTTTVPGYEDVALEGFPCDEEGARAVDPTSRDLVCQPGRRGKLRWVRA